MTELAFPYFRYRYVDAIVLFRYDNSHSDIDAVLSDPVELSNNVTIAFGAGIPSQSLLIADAKAGNNTYFLEAGIDADFTINSTGGGSNKIVFSQNINFESITDSSNTLKITVTNGGVTNVVTINNADRYTYEVGVNNNLTLQDILDDYGDGYEVLDTTILNPEHNILKVSDLVTSLRITDNNADDASYTLLTAPEGGELIRAGVSLGVGDSVSYNDILEGLVVLTITDDEDFAGVNLRLSDGNDAVAFNFAPSLRKAFSPLDIGDGNIVDRSSETDANIITTGDGDDTITAGSGDDVVEAGRGDDIINLNDSAGDNNGGVDEVVYRINNTNSAAFDGGDKLNGFRLGQDILTLEVHNAEDHTFDQYLQSDNFFVTFVYEADEASNILITGLVFHFKSGSHDENGNITKSYFELDFAESMTPTDFMTAVAKDGNLNIDVGRRSIIDLSVLHNLFTNDTLRLEPVYINAVNIADDLKDVDYIFFESTLDNSETIPLATLSLSDGSDINEYIVSVETEVVVEKDDQDQDQELNNAFDFGYAASDQTLFLHANKISAYGDAGGNKINNVNITITLTKPGAPDLILQHEVKIDTADVEPYFATTQHLELNDNVDYSDQGNAVVLGKIEAHDPNSSDSIAYSIIEVSLDGAAVADTAISNAFSIDSNTRDVSYNGPELKVDDGTYSITIRATSNGKVIDKTVDISIDTRPTITLETPSGNIVEAGIGTAGTAETVNNGVLRISDRTDLFSAIKLYARAGDNTNNGLDDPTNDTNIGNKEIEIAKDTEIAGTYGTFTFSRDADGLVTSWKYTLNDTDTDTDALESGITGTDTVKIIAYDDNLLASDVANAGVKIMGTGDGVKLSFAENLALTDIKISEHSANPTSVTNSNFTLLNLDVGTHEFVLDDFTVNEGDFESNRFSILKPQNAEFNEFQIVFTGDSDDLDYELESFIDINIQVKDNRDLANVTLTPHIVRVYVNDVTGNGENEPPIIDGLNTNDYTNVNVFTDDDKSDETDAVRYLLVGSSDDNNIHGSNNDDVVIGNAGDDTLNAGSGSDVIIIEFDSANKVFTSGIDHIDNFNIGEDTLLLSDSAADGINSLSAFIDLFTDNTHDSGIRVQFHVEDDVVTGLQLRSNDTSDRVNVYFSHSDRFDADADGIIAALGIPVADLPEGETIDFSEYYDSGTHRLQEKAFTATYIQNLFGENDEGLRVSDKATVTNKFAATNVENIAPVLASVTVEDPYELLSINAAISTNINNYNVHFEYGSGAADNIARLHDGNKANNTGAWFYALGIDRKHVTFELGREYYGGEVAIYNNRTPYSVLEDYINGSVIEFRLDGERVGDSYALHRGHDAGIGGETDNYKSPLNYSNYHSSNDQDNVLVVTAPNDLIFNSVKLTFHGRYQEIREVEIFGRRTDPKISENTDGVITGQEITVTDAEGASFGADDFTVYEADGEESLRFDIIASDGHYKLMLLDGNPIDYELENSVNLTIRATDGIDLSAPLDVVVNIQDLEGSNDLTPSLHEVLTADNDDEDGGFITLEVSDDAVDKSNESDTRYLFIGDSGKNTIHGSSGDDVFIGNNNGDGNDDRDTFNPGGGKDVIIVQFDSSTGLFHSGNDDITDFDLGEDTLLIADEGGMNSLSQFLSLMVEDGYGVRATLLLSDDETMVNGIQLRAENDQRDNRINIEFLDSDQFLATESGIRGALGMSDDDELSDYYNTDNRHLQDAAFTVEHFQNLLSNRDVNSNSNENALLITDIDNLPADFNIDGENTVPVLSMLYDDTYINLAQEFGTKVTVNFSTSGLPLLIDGDKGFSNGEYFQILEGHDRHITFTFAEEYSDITFALYNNGIFINDAVDYTGNIDNTRVDFNHDGTKTTYTIGSDDEQYNYDTPLHGNNAYLPSQDRVVVVSPGKNDEFDGVRYHFSGSRQYIREIEIYGKAIKGYIDENATGDIRGIKFDVDDDDPISDMNFLIYEDDGEVSSRFSVKESGDDYKIVVNDGHSIDHEIESEVSLTIEAYDGVNFSNAVDVRIRIKNLDGDDDTSTPIPTSDYDSKLITSHDVVGNTDGSHSTSGKRYLLLGNETNNGIIGTPVDDILVGGGGDDSLDGGPGADVFVFEFDSSTNRFISGSDTIEYFVRSEDKILIADSGAGVRVNSVQDFLTLFVEDGNGVRAAFFADEDSTEIIGIQLRGQDDHGHDNVNITFHSSHYFEMNDFHNTFEFLDDGNAVFSDYVETVVTSDDIDYYHLKEETFTTEFFAQMFGTHGFYVNDIDNIHSDII